MKARVRLVCLREEDCYQGYGEVDALNFDPIENVAAMVVSGSDHVRDALAEKLGLQPDERESFNEMVARSRNRLQRGATKRFHAHVGIARVLDM